MMNINMYFRNSDKIQKELTLSNEKDMLKSRNMQNTSPVRNKSVVILMSISNINKLFRLLQ